MKLKLTKIVATAQKAVNYGWVCPHCGGINEDSFFVKAYASAEGGWMYKSILEKNAKQKAQEKLPDEEARLISKLYTPKGLYAAQGTSEKLNGKCAHCRQTALWGLPIPDTTEHKVEIYKCDAHGKEIVHEPSKRQKSFQNKVAALQLLNIVLLLLYPLTYLAECLPKGLMNFIAWIVPGESQLLEVVLPCLFFIGINIALSLKGDSIDKSIRECKSKVEIEEEKKIEAQRVAEAREEEKRRIADITNMPVHNRPMFNERWQEYKKQHSIQLT